MNRFVQEMMATWGDMDFNGHMRNTAYLDKAVDLRLLYFQSKGFPMAEFQKLKIGPAVLEDKVEYYKEVHLLDKIQVSVQLAGISENKNKFRFRNEFFINEKKVAKVTSLIIWFSLVERKSIVPPDQILKMIEELEKSEDFALF